jgi:putative FmdB family regulatory protein
MPLYEYRCDACGHLFEQIQKFSDPLLSVCPECSGVLRKLVSSPAIQFKGTGWYVTDYAKKGTGAAAAGSENGKSSDGKDAASDKKSDSTDTSDTSAKKDAKSGDSKSSSDAAKKTSGSSTGSSKSTNS